MSENIYNNNTKELVKQIVCTDFEKLCTEGNYEEIENFIIDFRIDVNYDDGYFLEIMIERQDLALLKLFIKYGANVHINNEGMLRSAAHNGYIEILDYLINHCNANYKVLFDSTAYSNKKKTVEYLDKYGLKK